MLRPGVAPEEKERVENAMKNIQRELEALHPSVKEKEEEHESLQREGQEVTHRLKDAQKGRQELQEARNRVNVAKRKLRDAETEISRDSGAEKREIKNKLRQSVKGGLASLQAASEKYDEFLKASTELAGIQLTEEGKRQEYNNLR